MSTDADSALPFERPPKGWTKPTRLKVVLMLARLTRDTLNTRVKEHKEHLPAAIVEPLEAAVKSLSEVLKAGKPRAAKTNGRKAS